ISRRRRNWPTHVGSNREAHRHQARGSVGTRCLTSHWNGPWYRVAAPCARLQLVRGPVRICDTARPFNTIVRRHCPVKLNWVAIAAIAGAGAIHGALTYDPKIDASTSLHQASETKALIRVVASAIEQHRREKGAYPGSLDELVAAGYLREVPV